MLTIGEMGAAFTGPPCESPIEEAVEYRLVKYAANGCTVTRQPWVETLAGPMRLDFMLSIGALRIAIECDGAPFHEAYRDEWRDAVVLGDNQTDEVIRFAGQDLHHRPDDCVYLLSVLHPELFAERAREVLRRLASVTCPPKMGPPVV